MEKIESFKVNHLTLESGIYVSRIDKSEGVTVTTFDLRVTRPNREPVIDMPALHTLEHLGATYFRNSDIADKVVYFGPMGCRTGFYLLLFGEWTSEDIYERVLAFCDFVIGFEGDIPGASPVECGNYSEQNLEMARYYAKMYKKSLEDNKSFVYPD
ncbi:MAG: S-ribosylhomocysteine lyase [Clostridia bacterium]|nr:S-ribosylhomocysteine lyase [Clostridia bacterium]